MRNLLYFVTLHLIALCVCVCVCMCFDSGEHGSLGLRGGVERRNEINPNFIFPLGKCNSILLFYACKTCSIFPSICERTIG